MDDAIAAFLDYLAVEQGASAHTVRSYATDLAGFAAFLRESGDPGPAQRRHPRGARVPRVAAPERAGPNEHRPKARGGAELFPVPGAPGRGRAEPRPPGARARVPRAGCRRSCRRTSRRICSIGRRSRPSPAAATRRSSSCCTRAASASPSAAGSTARISTRATGRCACSARATRSAWCRSARSRSRRSTPISPRAAPAMGRCSRTSRAGGSPRAAPAAS